MPWYNHLMEKLVQNLIEAGVLSSPQIISAFLACDRKKFVPPEFAEDAYIDAPLPTLGGQTISQPSTVAFMMELLHPRPGQKILDVGFGSGWTTAILAHIAGERGKVYALEIAPDVFAFGQANLEKFNFSNVELFNRSGWEGLPESAPFDRILVSATAEEVPETLKMQLKDRGRMVIPVGSVFWSSVVLLKKMSTRKFEREDYPGFAFVPLVK